MNKNEKGVLRVVIATGIASVVFQLLAIREFLTLFQGNEFVIALILFSWLVLGGAGTRLAYLGSRNKTRATRSRLAGLSFLLAGLAVVEILAFRGLRDLFFIYGASVGFYPTFGYIFFTTAPYALLIGFVLPYSLFVLRAKIPDYPGARIYMADNIGDVSGGLLFSFVLVFLLTPLKSLFIANLVLALAAFGLFPAKTRFRPGPFLGLTGSLAVLIAGLFLETASLAPRDGKLALYRESRYGRLTVVQDRDQYTLFKDGEPLSSSQEIASAEEAVHYPLSQLDSPRDLLMISGQSGMLAEVLKYHPRSIDYVELDPEVTRIQFQFGFLEKIPGLHVLHQDGRAYLMHAHKLYDAIVINLPEPDTFQLNRFYTDSFFGLAKDHLSADGVLAFSVQGFDNYLAEPQREKLSSLYRTAARHFTRILLLPGQRIFFICANRPLDADIPARLAARKIATRYIRGYFYGNLTAERIAQLKKLIDPAAPVNSDTSPRLMRTLFSQWFAKFATSPAPFMLFLGILSILYLARSKREEFVLFSTSFMSMGSEILVIFAFQIFFGYIYFQIGIIVTTFLAGLLPGAWLGQRWQQKGRPLLRLSDLLLILLTGILILALSRIGTRLPVAFYLGFGFGVSFLCGLQFPVALHLRGGGPPGVTRIFSADLMGAACGTLVTSVVLIPYAGILWAGAALAGLKFMSFLWIGK